MSMLMRRDPRDPFGSMLERFFREPLLAEMPAVLNRMEEGLLPVDVSENETHVTVRASVPGFKREDIDVEVHDNVLTVKAQHKEEKEEKNERYYRKELSFGSASRRIALPSQVVDSDVSAELKDGVLMVRMPKVRTPSPKKVKIG